MAIKSNFIASEDVNGKTAVKNRLSMNLLILNCCFSSVNLFEYCRLIADNFKFHKNALCVCTGNGCASDKVLKMVFSFYDLMRNNLLKMLQRFHEKSNFRDDSLKRHNVNDANISISISISNRTHFTILIIIAFRYIHLTSNSRNRIFHFLEHVTTFPQRAEKQPQVIKKKEKNVRQQSIPKKMNYYRRQRLICNETLPFFGTCSCAQFTVIGPPLIYFKGTRSAQCRCVWIYSFSFLFNFGLEYAIRCPDASNGGISWWLVDPNLKTISYYFIFQKAKSKNDIVFVPELCNGVCAVCIIKP